MALVTLLRTLLLYALLSTTAYASAGTASKPNNEVNTHNPTIDVLEWQLHTLSEGIRVFSANVPASTFTAVLAKTTIHTNIDHLVRLIKDTTICQQWVYRCKHSSEYPAAPPLINTNPLAHNETNNSGTDSVYIYTLSRMPFPTKDRDVLAHITWETDPKTRVVTSTGIATTGVLPPSARYVRIENATIIWELSPLNANSTHIRSFAHVDPSGGIPSWISNKLALEIPLKTLSRLKAIAEEKTLQQPTHQSASPNNDHENDH